MEPMPTLTVDCQAIVENYCQLQAVADKRCGAVVKASLYGTQAFSAVTGMAAAGCRDFFVATASEADELYRHVALPQRQRLYVFNSDPQPCAGTRVINTAAEAQQADYIQALHIDTGMNRFGISPTDLSHIDTSKLTDDCLILTHLVESEVPGSATTQQQISDYHAAVALLQDRTPNHINLRTSIANSAGLFVPGADSQVARPGYALYGGNPTPWTDNPMKPVVTLTAPIAQVRYLTAGARVGYNGTWTAPKDCWVATVGVGYADGWLRSGSGQAMAEYRGQLVPSVGRISMDSMVILTGDTQPEVGDTVTLLGDSPSLSVDAVASRAGTIGYEVLTSLGNRFQRRYV